MTMTLELVLSHSQIRRYDECKYKWKLEYVDGWKEPKATAGASYRGTFIHALLNYWYTHEHVGMFNSHCKDAIETATTASAMTDYMRYVRIVQRYISEFVPIGDDGQTTLALEQKFEAEFTSLSGNVFKILGFIDRIYSRQGKVFIEDFKTIGSAAGWWSHSALLLDSQLTTYAALAPTVEELNLNNVDGVVVTQLNCYPYKRDFEQKAVVDLFRREMGWRSQTEKNNVLIEISNKADEIFEHLERQKPFTKSLTAGCAKCVFSEICEHDLKGHDTLAFLETKFMKKEISISEQLKKDEDD